MYFSSCFQFLVEEAVEFGFAVADLVDVATAGFEGFFPVGYFWKSTHGLSGFGLLVSDWFFLFNFSAFIPEGLDFDSGSGPWDFWKRSA